MLAVSPALSSSSALLLSDLPDLPTPCAPSKIACRPRHAHVKLFSYTYVPPDAGTVCIKSGYESRLSYVKVVYPCLFKRNMKMTDHRGDG